MKIYLCDVTNASVLFNGQLLQDAIWADEETGEAEVYEHEWRLDQRGARVTDSMSPYGYRTIELKGKVRISRPELVSSPDQLVFDCPGGICPW